MKKPFIKIGTPEFNPEACVENPKNRPREGARIAIELLNVGEVIQIDSDSVKKIESIRATTNHASRMSGKKFSTKKINNGLSIKIWRTR